MTDDDAKKIEADEADEAGVWVVGERGAVKPRLASRLASYLPGARSRLHSALDCAPVLCMAEPTHTLMMRETRIVTADGVPTITTEDEAIDGFGPAERYPDGSPANLTAAVIDMLRAPRRVYAAPMRIEVVA
mgnify:FL=1